MSSAGHALGQLLELAERERTAPLVNQLPKRDLARPQKLGLARTEDLVLLTARQALPPLAEGHGLGDTSAEDLAGVALAGTDVLESGNPERRKVFQDRYYCTSAIWMCWGSKARSDSKHLTI